MNIYYIYFEAMPFLPDRKNIHLNNENLSISKSIMQYFSLLTKYYPIKVRYIMLETIKVFLLFFLLNHDFEQTNLKLCWTNMSEIHFKSLIKKLP